MKPKKDVMMKPAEPKPMAAEKPKGRIGNLGAYAHPEKKAARGGKKA